MVDVHKKKKIEFVWKGDPSSTKHRDEIKEDALAAVLNDPGLAERVTKVNTKGGSYKDKKGIKQVSLEFRDRDDNKKVTGGRVMEGIITFSKKGFNTFRRSGETKKR